MKGFAISDNHSPQISDWISLIRADGVGPKSFLRLLDHFGTVERILASSVHELTKVEKIGTRTAERIRRSIGDFNVDKEIALADRLGVCIINIQDDRYPPALKHIYDPPPVLYYKGTLERTDSLAVAIVGCRRCTLYGSEKASRFAYMLASAGFTVVSGMARGIDTAAHRGALSAMGRTIAVQGCGLSNIFPPENKQLFSQITESGACISELPLTYEPLSENFPARNRIIAGLTMGTIVVEASSRSGALLTSEAAIANNREVMALPGRIDSPASIGTNRLIKQGAKLVDSVEDVMEALGYIGQDLKEHANAAAASSEKEVETPLFDGLKLNLSLDEQVVYDTLDGQAIHIEHLITSSGLAVGKVNASLISLRLKGLIKQLPGNVFKKL
ncbi:MAG: DNA-processing protein DprA [Anaerohalosphaera sp.]|nr:DNA-processing protein DprA [Anaerohalosphaera sp.]